MGWERVHRYNAILTSCASNFMRLISFVAGADAWLPAPKSSGKILKDKKVPGGAEGAQPQFCGARPSPVG